MFLYQLSRIVTQSIPEYAPPHTHKTWAHDGWVCPHLIVVSSGRGEGLEHNMADVRGEVAAGDRMAGFRKNDRTVRM